MYESAKCAKEQSVLGSKVCVSQSDREVSSVEQYTIDCEYLAKAIETGMILLIMYMKKNLLCIFFIDLYSPR